jgi:uncharacterized repeat protein (TIGR04076 family)
MGSSKVRITVLKCVDPSVIFDGVVPIRPGTGEEYSVCPRFKEGQVFIVGVDDRRPEGFCWWAWRDIYRDMFVLAFGGNFDEGWIEMGTQVSGCTDGIRPVSFKLERLNE